MAETPTLVTGIVAREAVFMQTIVVTTIVVTTNRLLVDSRRLLSIESPTSNISGAHRYDLVEHIP